MDNKVLFEITNLFATEGTITEIVPLGTGLINDTFKTITGGENEPDYVLQKVNNAVFPDVDLLMNNIAAVTSHIKGKLVEEGETDLKHHVLEFAHLRSDSNKYYAEVDGKFWRMMVFVDNTITKQDVNVENSLAAGAAFGRFQAMLADIPAELGETIKDFHNMEFRISQLKEVAVADVVGRFDEPEVQALLEEIGKRSEEMTSAERLYREGKLPKRICHCDTKVNNMLFSADGKEVMCIIDLDTVMPSFIFSDYGDFLRTAANTVAEDCAEFDKIEFKQDIFEAFTEGYLSSARSFLTPLEIEMLPYAVKLFPYMQSVRFLWDYLSGDKYWKCQYDKHNLVRAQNQMELVKRIEAADENIKSFIASKL